MNINNIDHGEASQFILAYLQENGIDAYQEPGWSDTMVSLAGARLRITAYSNGVVLGGTTITGADQVEETDPPDFHLVSVGQDLGLDQFSGSIFDPECFPKLLAYVKGIVEQYSI